MVKLSAVVNLGIWAACYGVLTTTQLSWQRVSYITGMSMDIETMDNKATQSRGTQWIIILGKRCQNISLISSDCVFQKQCERQNVLYLKTSSRIFDSVRSGNISLCGQELRPMFAIRKCHYD